MVSITNFHVIRRTQKLLNKEGGENPIFYIFFIFHPISLTNRLTDTNRLILTDSNVFSICVLLKYHLEERLPFLFGIKELNLISLCVLNTIIRQIYCTENDKTIE